MIVRCLKYNRFVVRHIIECYILMMFICLIDLHVICSGWIWIVGLLVSILSVTSAIYGLECKKAASINLLLKY